MSYNPEIHHRRSIRLKGYDYSQAGLYFATICVQNKECLFGEIVDGKIQLNDTGKIVEKCWLEIPQHYPDAVLHEFVVMPNHIHGIIELAPTANVGVENFRPLQTDNNTNAQTRPNCKSRSIGAIVRGFKIGVTKQIGFSIWQRNYYEQIIRNQNAYQEISDYIFCNPLKWNTDDLFM